MTAGRPTRALALGAALAAACAHAPAPPPVARPAEAAPPPAVEPRRQPGPEPPAPPPDLVFAAVGDVMLGSAFPDDSGLPPDDGAGLLAEAAPMLSRADVAFANLEGPLADSGVSEKCARSRPGRCWAFRTPTRYARHLAEAGFDVVSLANNHAGDFGAEGRESTRRALDAVGIAHAGEPGEVARLLVKGRRIALVAFATSDGTPDLRDVEGARRVVEDLARTADLVVVSFHGGAEGAAHQRVPAGGETFLGEDRGDVRAFARAAVDAGAALVLGHGPHVVRGMEIHRGRLIAYSLGNFATWGAFNLSGPNGLSLVLEARLGPDGSFREGRVHPVRQLRPGGPRLDPRGEVIPLLRRLSREDFGASAVEVAEDGTLRPPAEGRPSREALSRAPPGYSASPSAPSERLGLPSSAAAIRAASKRPKAAKSSPAR